MPDTATAERVDDTQEVVDGAESTESTDGKWVSSSAFAGFQRDLNATVWRLRRQLLPHAITGGVACGGLAMHAMAAAGGGAPIVSLLTAAGAYPAAALWWMATKRRRPRWATRVLAAGMTAATWLALAPFGMTYEQGALLLAADYAFASGWWQRNRVAVPDSEDDVIDVEPEDIPEPTLADEIIADWNEFVACDGGPLPRSELSNPEVTKHTIAFDLELWRGRQSLSTAFAALEKIAGGVDHDVDEVILEGLPKTPNAGKRRSPARARFQIITDSPISGDVKFTGPRRRDGFLDLGPFADGSGEASYRLYTPGSMWSGVIIGGTGIGKSRVVENIGISAKSGGDTIIIYVDPQGGVSSPALAKHSYLFVPGMSLNALIAALLAGIAARGEENSAYGWTGFDPSPERPGILTILEECHRPFSNKNAAKDWSYVAREGRKVGFGLLCISQYPGLETFGGNEALRSSIMEGNAIVLRTTSNQTKSLMPGLDVDPKTLPKIPGYAYILGSEENGLRTAPFRNRDTGKDSKVTGAWLAAQPDPKMDALLENAIARSGGAALFRDREEAARTRQEVSLARVEALRNGQDPDAVAPRFVDTSPVADETTSSDENLGVVIEFPGPITVEQLHAEPAENSAALRLTDSHRAILTAVAAGKTRPSEIEAAIGLKHRRVAELLKELLAAGYLIQPQYGRYERAA